SVPRMYALVWPAYGAVVLAIDARAGIEGERVLGVLTWVVLLAALRPLPTLARAQVIGGVVFATVGGGTGSILCGGHHYRLAGLRSARARARLSERTRIGPDPRRAAGGYRRRARVPRLGNRRSHRISAARRRRRDRRRAARRLPLALTRARVVRGRLLRRRGA